MFALNTWRPKTQDKQSFQIKKEKFAGKNDGKKSKIERKSPYFKMIMS